MTGHFRRIVTGVVFCCGLPGVLRPSATHFSSCFVSRSTISGCFASRLVFSLMSARVQ